MRKLACIAAAVAVLSCSLLEERAEASHFGGASIAAMSVATAGGLTTSIAAITYAAEGRSFGPGWVFVALVTSALFFGTVIGLLPDAGSVGPLIGVVLNAGFGAWPLYWTARTAWSDVEPGALFEPEMPAGPGLARGLDVTRGLSGRRRVVIPRVTLRF